MAETGQKPSSGSSGSSGSSRVVKSIEQVNEGIRQLLVETAGQYRTAKETAESWEAERKRLGGELQGLLLAAAADTVVMEKYEVIKANGRSGGKLNENKLMEKGVDPDVIAECWDGGTAYTYAQVKERKNAISNGPSFE